MTCVRFPCGDLERTAIIEFDEDQVCVEMPFGPFWTDREQVHFLPMKRGRRMDTVEAQRRGEMIRYWYYYLGRTEREIASELGIKCSTVNYYKNRQKR